MKFRFPSVARVLVGLIAGLIVSTVPGFCGRDCDGNYAPWGVEEYELFGLTKQELTTTFRGRLFFTKDFDRANFLEKGTGLGYEGPVFYLEFSKGKVCSVQGAFVGCVYTYWRPNFKTKEAALNYAIANLPHHNAEKASRAKRALSELKQAASAKISQAASMKSPQNANVITSQTVSNKQK